MSSRSEVLREAMARRVRELRTGRSWSLDQLVRQSGVSKGVLVQIEQGQGNPSLATLVRVSDAFGTTVTQLLEGGRGEDTPRITRAGEGPILWSDGRGSWARLLLGLDHDDHVELWNWRLAPGAAYPSEPHAAGTTEMAQV
ncbi:MAG: helix-turn-helix domain-containing protein, partial [Candidatus Dormibacteraceae bacterium]